MNKPTPPADRYIKEGCGQRNVLRPTKENGIRYSPDLSSGIVVYKSENMQVLARQGNEFLVKSNKTGNFYTHIEPNWISHLFFTYKNNVVIYSITEQNAFLKFMDFDEKFVKAEDVFNLVKVGFEDA